MSIKNDSLHHPEWYRKWEFASELLEGLEDAETYSTEIADVVRTHPEHEYYSHDILLVNGTKIEVSYIWFSNIQRFVYYDTSGEQQYLVCIDEDQDEDEVSRYRYKGNARAWIPIP